MRDTLLVSSSGHTATLGALSSVLENPGQRKFAAKTCSGMSRLLAWKAEVWAAAWPT
jgi:hypothetical protein